MIEIDSIYNEDCLEGMKRIDDASVDLVVTSPPYDELRKYGGIADSWSFDKFKQIAQQIARVLADGGVCVWIVSDGTVNGSESCTSFKQAIYFKEECGLSLYDTMIWEKPSPQAPTESRYYDVFEYMFVLCKGQRPKALNFICDHKNITAGGVSKRENRSNAEQRKDTGKMRPPRAEYSRRFNVWNVSRGESKTGHPAVFPLELARAHVYSWSNMGGGSLRPFHRLWHYCRGLREGKAAFCRL